MAMTLLTQLPQDDKAVMSQLPSQEQDSGGQVLEFTGLDVREEAASGAYLSCKNVSTRNYPCLSPRKGRGQYLYAGVDDFYRFDGVTVFRKGTRLWYDDGDGASLIATVTDTRKSFAVVNNIIVVFPDAIGIRMATGTSFELAAESTVGGTPAIVDDRKITGSIAGLTTIESGDKSCATYAGGPYIYVPYYDTEPYTEGWTEDSEQRLIIHTATEGAVAALVGKWVIPAGDSSGYDIRIAEYRTGGTVNCPERNKDGVYGLITAATFNTTERDDYTYTNIKVTLDNGTSGKLKVGDVLFVDGLYKDGELQEDVAFRVWGISTDYIDLGVNALYGYTLGSAPVVLRRKVPALDFICASSNRLWGVSNAVENTVLDDDGNPVKFNGRAVFCSKLGDPANWYYYQGVSMDSWTAAVASEGDFTGICEWSDDVLCFKSTEMFRITGSQPSSYTMYSFSVPGVEAGSGDSIAVIDEAVYYKSAHGVYRYTGGTPYRISEQIGGKLEGAGHGGTDGRNYFLSVPDGLFAYDTWHNCWVQYDDIPGRFAWDAGTALILSDGGKVFRMDSASADGVSWRATLHPDYGTAKTSYYSTALNMGYKYYKFVFLRGELLRTDDSAAEPSVTVLAKMGNQATEVIGTQSGVGKFVLRMPVSRFREDCIQLSLTGTGDCILRDIRYVYSTGAEWVQSDKGAM